MNSGENVFPVETLYSFPGISCLIAHKIYLLSCASFLLKREGTKLSKLENPISENIGYTS
jgi:hypothetical protein